MKKIVKGAGVLAFAIDTGKFLLGQRSYNISSPGRWATLGGKFEQNETDPKTVATREFKEESGYQQKFEIFYIYTFKSASLSFYSYLGIVPKQFVPNPIEKFAIETNQFKWLNWEEMLKLDNKHVGLEDMLTSHASKIKEKLKL